MVSISFLHIIYISVNVFSATYWIHNMRNTFVAFYHWVYALSLSYALTHSWLLMIQRHSTFLFLSFSLFSTFCFSSHHSGIESFYLLKKHFYCQFHPLRSSHFVLDDVLHIFFRYCIHFFPCTIFTELC